MRNASKAARAHSVQFEDKIKKQFSARSAEFDISARWISDERLIGAHTDLAGGVLSKALDLCCGTGQVGRALKQKGWDACGLDICSTMVKTSFHYFPVVEGKAEEIPYKARQFQLVVCRQAFQFLNARKVLSEIARVLKPKGICIISLTVPFSEKDSSWLFKIHRVKQPLLLKFHTADSLREDLSSAGFSILECRTLVVRESINRWMAYSPELDETVRKRVCFMVKNAPAAYKEARRVEIVNGEIYEDWNWIVLKASF